MRKIKYLLVEHLPLFVSCYEKAIREVCLAHSHIYLYGNTINPQDKVSLDSHLEGRGLQFIFINMDSPDWNGHRFKTPLAFLAHIRKHYPEIQILVGMHQATVYRFKEIYTPINPESIVAAVDCTSHLLVEAISHLLDSEVFYSKTILKIFQSFLKANQQLDHLDYSILYELSIGTKIKELPGKIFLSPTTIFKRKQAIKMFFDVSGKSDRKLVEKARLDGFV